MTFAGAGICKRLGKRASFPCCRLPFALLVYYILNASVYPLSADEMIRRTEATVLSAKTVAAEFTLSIRWQLRDTTEEKTGVLLIKKPDKYKISFGPNEFVSDGKTFWRYSKKNRQVVINRSKDVENEFQPGSWFFRYSEEYKPIGMDSSELNHDPHYVINLVPKTKAKFAGLRVWISAKSALPGKIETTDKNENQATYLLNHVITDTLLSDKLFQFKPPKDAEVIDMRE